MRLINLRKRLVFQRVVKVGVVDTIPQVEIGWLEFIYSLPKSFYTDREYTSYIVRRMKLLSIIKEEDEVCNTAYTDRDSD